MNGFTRLVCLAALAGNLSGCATTQTRDAPDTGPTIISLKAEPALVQVTRNLDAPLTPVVTADVRDGGREVREVKLRFLHLPLEVPLENVGGSIWRAKLSREQIAMLAVGGHTITYQAHVVARDDLGLIAISRHFIDVAVRTPDLSTRVASRKSPGTEAESPQ
jgi:hypothetical protein